MQDTTFSKFIKSLTEDELTSYAQRCGTSAVYLTGHLRPGYKTPRKELMAALVINSKGALTRDDVLTHFYPASAFNSSCVA